MRAAIIDPVKQISYLTPRRVMDVECHNEESGNSSSFIRPPKVSGKFPAAQSGSLGRLRQAFRVLRMSATSMTTTVELLIEFVMVISE